MNIRIELPYPLPLWNRILAMGHFERKKLRHWIHASLSQLQATGTASMTPTVYRLKPCWMALYSAEYYAMIRPSKYKKSVFAAKKRKKKRMSEQQLKSITTGRK